jgi:L-asparagine transporter-like permease
MVLVLLAFNKDTVIALYVAPVWVAILVVGVSRLALSPRQKYP